MGRSGEEECIDLPPGFRFHPTDEEIISHYLLPKLLNHSFSAMAVGEVDLNKCEPWDMPSKAKMGEKEWYFFCQRDRKYPTGMRTNRATEAGYWKATGKDKEIFRGRGVLVGMKKTLVFYRGRAPKGEKTNWVMHEYRFEGKTTFQNLPKNAKDEWVVCRVFNKSNGAKKSIPMAAMLGTKMQMMSSFREEEDEEEDLESAGMPPPFMDPSATEYNSGGRTVPALSSTFFSTLLGLEGTMNVNAMKRCGADFAPPYNNYFVGNELQSSSSAAAAAAAFYPQIPATSSAAFGYLPPDHAMLKALRVGGGGAGNITRPPLMVARCKVEQASNQSMLSQDTGGEISSAMSKNSFDDVDDAAVGPGLNLKYMWNKY